MSLSRRSLLTILAALPGAALLSRFLKAPPTEDELYLKQLRFFYDTMKQHGGESPDALFVHEDVMKRFARLFNIEPRYGEFECPWGGDICGTPSLGPNEVDIACRGSAIIYKFEWDNFSYVRSDPAEWHRQNPGVFYSCTYKTHFLRLPKRPLV